MILPQLSYLDIAVNSDDLNNLKILHLSDLHINKKTSPKSLEELVNLCNSCDADFIVITGDLIDCKVKKISNKLEMLKDIKKKVFFISGNHDLFYGIKPLVTLLDNFEFLDNSYTFFNFNNKNIAIAGLSDRFSKFFGIKREEKKIIDFLKKYDSNIFLSHQPKDYKIALNSNAKLFLCGHTHGGQIYPFHYFVKLFQPFLAGVFYIKNTTIYVSKGLGCWGINFRYKADCEIMMLTLKSKSVK